MVTSILVYLHFSLNFEFDFTIVAQANVLQPEDDFDIHLDGAEGGNVKPFGAVTDDDATSINAETESVASQDIRFDYLRLR